MAIFIWKNSNCIKKQRITIDLLVRLHFNNNSSSPNYHRKYDFSGSAKSFRYVFSILIEYDPL